MASFNNTKGGDIEGQIKNNSTKQDNVSKLTLRDELFINQAMSGLENNGSLLLSYSCLHERVQSMDTLIALLNMEREFSEDYNYLASKGAYLQVPLFDVALDKEGYEILAWSEEEDSVVRTPHKKGDA
jgi:hypothetical protein